MRTATKKILLLLVPHVFLLTSAVEVSKDDESHSVMPAESMGSNELNIEVPSDAPRNKKICGYLFILKMEFKSFIYIYCPLITTRVHED